MCLVFGIPHNIWAIFKPVVGDFYEHFSNQGFFDSLVGQRAKSVWKRRIIQSVEKSTLAAGQNATSV
jgi:hypothetical protein